MKQWAAILACALAAALATGCERGAAADGRGQPAGGQAPEVRTVLAWTGEVEQIVRSVGQVRPVNAVTLAAEVAGLVRAVHFEEGALVQAGDLLIELDDQRARAELDSARAVRDRAARQLERFEQAASTQAASLTELDTVRTEFAQASAQFELARIRVQDHRIVAPFTGRVGLRLVSQGAFIQPGSPLTTLTTVDPVDLEFAVPEVYLAQLRPGLEVIARSVAFDRDFPGTVRVISPEVDQSTRTALVLARGANPDGLLRPGMYVTVRVVVGRRSDAVLAPEESLQFQGSQASVYVVNGDVAQRRRVRIGEWLGGVVEIIEGLEAGEQVVTQGLQRIRDGSRVRPVMEDRADTAEAAGSGGTG